MLLARIAAAVQKEQPPKDERALLPYDVLHDVLVEHELTVAMRVSASDAHAALVALHTRMREGPAATMVVAEEADEESEDEALCACPHCAHGSIQLDACIECLVCDHCDFVMTMPGDGRVKGTKKTTAACPDCDEGRAQLDAREGCLVCDRCGVVLTGSINVEAEYVAPVVLPRARFQRRGVPGVPKWMLQQSAAYVIADPSQRRSKHWPMLEHWNHYGRLSLDELERADAAMRTWSDATHSLDARMAAVLLYPRLRAQFPTTEDVRLRLRGRAALEVVADPTPAPRFACGGCGALCHTGKEARVHCRVASTWGVRKRGRGT